MKISYNWLKEYCPVDLPAHELAEGLSRSGLCVETYEPAGKDWMLDVEVTSNRPDCLSHIGVGREVAALTATRISHPEIDVPADDTAEFNDHAAVEVNCPKLCPHYTARLIRNVQVGPSPDWMQQRLEVCGIRPVNNIVDITNYVLLESGQPLHAFDLARLQGSRIIVRRARNGETITTIDGTEQELSSQMCVIADAQDPVAVAGVMGGLDSEIGPSTTDILLESARFDPPTVRRTSRSLGLSSESSYRFERGVDPDNVDRASRRAAQFILEIAGGTLASGKADIRSDQTPTPTVNMRMARMQKVLGLEVEPETVRSIFEGLELSILEQTPEGFSVEVPSWRSDLEREIDLIEEVARVHGYDKISEATHIPVQVSTPPERQRHERTIRRLLTGEGFDEVITYSLVQSTPTQKMQLWSDAGPIPLRNPVSSDKTHLRLTNLANLLEVKRFNAAHGTPSVDLFELGKVYLPRGVEQGQLPEEKRCLSVMTDRDAGFFVLKGVLDNLLEALHCEQQVSEEGGEVEILDPSQSLVLRMEDRLLGWMGIVAAKVADDADLDNRPALMEIDFDLLAENASIHPTVRAVPKYPAVQRDIAVVVDEQVQWKDLRECISEAGSEQLESVEFFDIYRGEPVPAGCKSVAFSVTFRSPERTLTREEADRARDEIIAVLKDQLNAKLRT
jgi:phenylalanyl-tRNA synthetase beta chain